MLMFQKINPIVLYSSFCAKLNEKGIKKNSGRILKYVGTVFNKT